MTVSHHLDEALVELLQAKEAALQFKYPPELVERIDLVKRATAKLKSQIADSQKA